MKNRFLILSLLFLSLIACSSNENIEEIDEQQKIPAKMQPTPEWPSLLLGKWEFVEQCESNAISGSFTCRTPSKHQYNFISETNVLTDRFSNDCEDGIYSLEENFLSIQFSCADIPFETEIHVLDDKQLILVFSGGDSTLYRIYKRIEK